MSEDRLSDPTDDTGEGEQERLHRTETSHWGRFQTAGDCAVRKEAGSKPGSSTSK